MGKQKQQVISRFFAPKPQNPSASTSSSSSSQSCLPSPLTPPPKISATVTFSPSKRLRSSQLTSPIKPSKIPKLCPQAHKHIPFLSSLSRPSNDPLEPALDKRNKYPKLSPHTHNPIPPESDPTLHQRFLQKLLEPSEDLRDPSSVPSNSNPKYTPLEQQVVDLKTKYPDVLLMVEVGYRYRFFGKDAENAARVLGIYAHMDHNFLTASVPTFRFNVHVRRLVSAGYKVGVVKQTETAAIKAHGANRLGPFCRGLSALYTKATLEVAEDVGGGEEGCGSCSSYLTCIVEKSVVIENGDCGIESGFDVRIGFVAVEISTGDVVHGEFNDNFMRAGLEAMILSLSPVELLIGEPLSNQTEKLLVAYAGPASNVRMERVSHDCFKDGGALAEVLSLYENMNRNSLVDPLEEETAEMEGDTHLQIKGILDMPDLAIQALALIIRHLKQFGFERILCLGASFRSFSSNMEMTLSANALQQLEVLNNNSDGSESGSLLQCMNHTLTIFGSRLLRHWVAHPLRDRNMINARLDAISEIAESIGSHKVSQNSGNVDCGDSDVLQSQLSYVISSILTSLGRSPDIQRGITRIFHRTSTASEFITVIQAILVAGKKLQQLHIEEEEKSMNRAIKIVNSVLLRKLILTASSSSVIGNAAELLSFVNKEAADKGDLPNLFIISNGQFPEVARARMAVQLSKEKLDSLIDVYRKQLGMRKLEFMSVSGATHLIEMSSDVKVPSNWVKVNSTKKSIRYHPPEVLTALDQLSLANEELAIVCRAAWDGFLMAFSKHYAEFQSAVQALAALDCLYSLAILSKNKNYVRPIFVSDDEPVQIHICSGRHPVLETILIDNFVPNDTNLHSEGEHCQIVTGPNMGGKSCYIRQVALIAIMAQVGSFVPASSAKLHVLDGIHTRMGASDSIQRGRSTFLEELSEASHIVAKCSPHSLVIIDELGRGTSTHDGVAIAYATLLHLLEQKRCMILFVTHYPKIVDIKQEFPVPVGVYHVSYLTSHSESEVVNSNIDQAINNTDHEDVIYLYKLVPGVSERSFGFKVAELAQIPSSCIHRAIVMAAKLETAVCSREKNRLTQISLKEASMVDHEAAQEDTVQPLGRYHAKVTGGLEELADSYKEFFFNLNSALRDDDIVKSREFLRQARRSGMELISR